MARGWLVAALAVAGMAVAAHGSAQGGDASRAAALFEEGRVALDQGQYALACTKFDESLALVPRPSTILNLATCHEKQGHLVQAFNLYRQGIEKLPSDDPKLKQAMEMLDALTKRLPRLSVKLPASLPVGAKLELDGKALEQIPVQGVPVDPGQHALLLTAPGRADTRTAVTLVESQQLEITLALGEPTGGPTAPTGPTPTTSATETTAPPPPPTAGTGETAPAPPPSEGGDGSTLTTAGLVVGGIGIASFVVAGITGGILLSRDSDIEAECPNQQCTAEGADLISGSEGLIIGNWVTWIVGIAGVGVGAVLVGVGLSSDDGADSADATARVVPLAGPGLGGLLIEGSF